MCLKYQWDEDKGEVILGRDGEPDERFDACPPPCRTERGCPKGTPENPKTLWTATETCYEHYLECRAVGEFPDDSIVRRNARVIRELEDLEERQRQGEFQSVLMSLVMRRA